ncbi:hypothetical protein CYMTET_22090 [Cymbomonas tetramitiformis]|uniref:BZIP domain-containing protein n=1 Tax=Cymbomonas tetramitiformis TaxID=36881 RepID=A0AAE0G131_9CHLO|nr:hypothetical protein CYMTET_22090 [Cymbomonas tetramitiformis]
MSLTDTMKVNSMSNAGQMPVPNRIYSFPESGFPPFLERGPGQPMVQPSANPSALPNPSGSQHIQFNQQMCVDAGITPNAVSVRTPSNQHVFTTAPSTSGPFAPGTHPLNLPQPLAPYPVVGQPGPIGYSNKPGPTISQLALCMHSEGDSALPDNSSHDYTGSLPMQGPGQYSAELKDMPEAPNKRRGHRRSASQPTDMTTFSQPQQTCAEQEEQHWSQLEQATAAGMGGTAFGPGTSRVDRKGAARPPATAALAAIVAGAPLVGPDAAQAALLDPKRAKRILANRQSAARSKERKLRYINELERRVSLLTSEATNLSEEFSSLQRESHNLGAEKDELDKQLKTLEQSIQQRDKLNNQMQSSLVENGIP